MDRLFARYVLLAATAGFGTVGTVGTAGCGSNMAAPAAATPDGSLPVTGDDAAVTDAGAGADVLQPGSIDAGVGGPPPPLTDNVTLHIAGDSTAAIFAASDPTMRVGWGAVLQPLFGAGVTVDDAARSGRSSKSFIDEGFWASTRAQIHPGDYVLIQFAHNDEKVGDTARFTDPATTFPEYLKVYIRDTRQAGGFAILLTPIARRQFAGTAVVQTHGNWPAAIAAVAAETGTPLIDMTAKTTALLQALGPVDSLPLFAVGDNTHLSAVGAPMVAQLVVDGFRELALPIVERLASP